jgi:hypothetical protein
MIGRSAHWLAISGVAVAMLAWSWGTWPHLLVDFGRELYAPWRLLEGEVLYRDMPWFDGPLSPYWNAGVFSLFGVSLRALVLANLALVCLLVVVLHALLSRATDRAGATTACIVFVSLFAFTRIDAIGNDNYLTPYSHGVTHGLLLSLCALLAFARRDERRTPAVLCSGFALGLAALTKAEIFVAAAAALALGFSLDAAVRRHATGDAGALRTAGCFVAAFSAAPLAAFALLALAMPAADALRGTLGTWSSLAASTVASQHFYRSTLGTLELGANLVAILAWGAAWVAAGAVLVGLARAFGAARAPSAALVAGVAAAVFLATIATGDLLRASWPDALRPLPLAVLALAVLSALRLHRAWPGAGESAGARSRELLWLVLLVFAGVLLAKIALRVRLDQYGFALAMPATLLVVAWFVARLPATAPAAGGDMATLRAGAVALVAAVVVSFLPLVGLRFDERSERVGRSADAFLTEPANAAAARQALAALEALPEGASLAVVPEGVMLNYLTRRQNPTGILNFMPPELIVFGEERILAAFEASPPDFIALTHKDTREYGLGFFGRGYARSLGSWVERNYTPVARFGDPPLEEGSVFGVALLERRRAHP